MTVFDGHGPERDAQSQPALEAPADIELLPANLADDPLLVRMLSQFAPLAALRDQQIQALARYVDPHCAPVHLLAWWLTWSDMLPPVIGEGGQPKWLRALATGAISLSGRSGTNNGLRDLLALCLRCPVAIKTGETGYTFSVEIDARETPDRLQADMARVLIAWFKPAYAAYSLTVLS